MGNKRLAGSEDSDVPVVVTSFEVLQEIRVQLQRSETIHHGKTQSDEQG